MNVLPLTVCRSDPNDESSAQTDLVTMFVRVPSLLDSCVCANMYGMRDLRLVNKAASKAALRALRSFTLKLNGDKMDTNVSVACLLQGAHLKNLIVNTTLSGEWDVAHFQEGFSPISC